MQPRDFETVARRRAPALDELALSLAAEFRDVDRARALAELDRLGAKLAPASHASPAEEVEACRLLLAVEERYVGNRTDYGHPDNSMLDLVLERRTGLPILLSIVYVEVARRAGIALEGVGLPGHYVVGHFGSSPPLLLDPFSGGRIVSAETRPELVRPWRVHETALRMLNNLVQAYATRGDLAHSIRAAELRLVLPVAGAGRETLEAELRALRARLN